MPLLPGAVVDQVPLFPLSQVVLFPGVTLPLHIFEPRYREMTRDAIAGDALLVIVQTPEGAATGAGGRPALSRVATIGRITRHDALPDGRYNILVGGLARVALEELPQQRAYRCARATVLGTTCRSDCAVQARALRLTAAEFVSRIRGTHPSFDFSIDVHASPGSVADQIGHYLVVDPAERQHILETLDDCDRVDACLEALMRQSAGLGGGEALH